MRKIPLIVVFLLVGFSVGYIIAEPLRGGLVTALQPILANPIATTALITAMIALLVGLLGFIGNWRQVNVAKIAAESAKTSADAAMMSAKYAGTRALANVRITWLETLRDTLSEYHSILMNLESEHEYATDQARALAKKKQDEDNRKLSYLGTKLDLLLNQQKQYQKDLWQISDDILKLNNPTDTELELADEKLVAAARKVLDFHWRKIKAEILGEPALKEPPSSASQAN